jgi:hypothetical protein
VILVSAAPVYGLELQERRQKFLVGKVGPYEIDFEAWHSNLAGLCEFMRVLIDDLGLRSCVILSGDVHYGLNVKACFSYDGRALSIAQLVSSAVKHSGTVARTTLQLLGAAVRPDHARVGWDTPPRIERGHRLLMREVNTDAWADDAPVFLPPTVAGRLIHDQPPRYRETRSYVRPAGRRASVITGDNNLGAVSVRLADGVVLHQLLARRAGTTIRNTAELSIAPAADHA